jgi:hypothetical protein
LTVIASVFSTWLLLSENVQSPVQVSQTQEVSGTRTAGMVKFAIAEPPSVGESAGQVKFTIKDNPN